jgi:hypothetical protein
MAIGADGAAYMADMDSSATPGQTAEVQRLFDEIGLDLHVSATYTVKSAAGEVAEAVLWLAGAGVARVYLSAAGSFGKALGDELGTYTGKRIKKWLEQLRRARGQQVSTIIQDPLVRAEILLTGNEPPEALEQLKELIDNDRIPAIPGKAAQIEYREGDGWVRPF